MKGDVNSRLQIAQILGTWVMMHDPTLGRKAGLRHATDSLSAALTVTHTAASNLLTLLCVFRARR